MDAAANGQGIALAPRLLIERDLEEGRLVKIWQDKSAGQDGYYLVWPDNADQNQERDYVLSWILSQVKSD
jgi:LysR family glycine cleavage system transcriptional activator